MMYGKINPGQVSNRLMARSMVGQVSMVRTPKRRRKIIVISSPDSSRLPGNLPAGQQAAIVPSTTAITVVIRPIRWS